MSNSDVPEQPLAGSTPPRPVTGPAQGTANHGPQQPLRRRKTIAATCELHRGPIGFTNLVVSKRDGTIVLDPHVDGSCVISLDQDGATQLCDTLTEWLG
jgi:hypothetical protein